jgi:hypothetical protein
MYQFSYNDVVEDSPIEMRAREREAMDKALVLLRIARDKGPGSREAVDALYFLDEQGDRSRPVGTNERPDPDHRDQRNHSQRPELRIP